MKNESLTKPEKPELVRRLQTEKLYRYRGFNIWIRQTTRNTYPGGFQKRHKVTTYLAFGVPGIELDGIGGLEVVTKKIDRAIEYRDAQRDAKA